MCCSLKLAEGSECDRGRSAICRRAPILIIAPSSVLDNWAREFSTWGSFSVCIYSKKQKSGAVTGVKDGRHEIMLISFDTYRYKPC